MKKIIAGNFKMNKSLKECEEYIKAFNSYLVPDDKFVIMCPPIFAVDMFSKNKNFSVGGQNVSAMDNGAYTGEISAKQLASLNAKYCLVGHSERREFFQETSNIVVQKIKQLQKENIIPIICVGEKLHQVEVREEFLQKQLLDALHGYDGDFIVAYEPVWAIGTGKTCSLEDIKAVLSFIKKTIKSITKKSIPVLYGGSVKPENAKEILSLDEVDGVLVGGACLNADSFKKIIEA